MKKVFKDILNMDGVNGLLLLSHEGAVLFENFATHVPFKDKRDWLRLVMALGDVREADIVFQKARIYVRRSEVGYLFILVTTLASIAMLRLNCDIILPSLKQAREHKGLKRFFAKK